MRDGDRRQRRERAGVVERVAVAASGRGEAEDGEERRRKIERRRGKKRRDRGEVMIREERS